MSNVTYLGISGYQLIGMRLLRRLLFHFMAMSIACFLALYYEKTYYFWSTAFFIFPYLSLLVIFPNIYTRRSVLIFSWLSMGISIFFIPLFIGLVFAAFQRWIMDFALRKGRFDKSDFINIFMLSILCWSVVTISPYQTSLFPQISLFFWVLYGVFIVASIVVAFGIEKGLLLQQLSERPCRPNTLLPLNEVVQDTTDQALAVDSSNQPFVAYYTMIDKLLTKKDQLPVKLALSIEQICEVTRLILRSMEADPRDVEPGEKFLQRYFVAVEKIVEQCLYIFSFGMASEQAIKVQTESEVFLTRMVDVFREKQKRLLDNNTQDLTVELNVLNKMLQIEGHD